MTKVQLHRIIRRRELPDFVGLKRTQIDALIIRGEFPRPIKLNDNGRAKGWLEHEIVVWQQETQSPSVTPMRKPKLRQGTFFPDVKPKGRGPEIAEHSLKELRRLAEAQRRPRREFRPRKREWGDHA